MNNLKTVAEMLLSWLNAAFVLFLIVSAFITGGFLIGIIYRLVSAGFKFGAGL